MLEPAEQWCHHFLAWVKNHPVQVGMTVNLIVLGAWWVVAKIRPDVATELEAMRKDLRFRGPTPYTEQGLAKREKDIRVKVSFRFKYYVGRFAIFFLPGLLLWALSLSATAFAAAELSHPHKVSHALWSDCLAPAGTLLWQATESLSFGIPTLAGFPPPPMPGGVWMRVMMFLFGLVTTLMAAKLVEELLSCLRFFAWQHFAPGIAAKIVSREKWWKFISPRVVASRAAVRDVGDAG